MSLQRFSGDAMGRVSLSFLLGVIIGNLIWMPYSGALAIGFALGGIALAAPLAFIAAIVAGFADEAIKKRLALWCIAAALAVTALYALFDPPTDRDGVERLVLALTCSVVSAATFFVLSRRSTA